ncbi:MAG: 50S ribosomal protein L10 [Chloroflexi bacterium]|nr:50S ribosomal protein L10 [Chloroflexota bacterium]
MPSARNVKLQDAISEKLGKSKVAIATDFAGIPTATLTELRRHLRAHGMDYKVVKNTLLMRSADALGKAEVKELLAGPTGVAFGYDDPIAAIKTITDYVRTNRSPINVRGAAFEGRVFRGDQLVALTQLPPKPVLVAQLLGQLNAPIARLVNALNSPLAGLAIVLQQRAKQLEGAPQQG